MNAPGKEDMKELLQCIMSPIMLFPPALKKANIVHTGELKLIMGGKFNRVWKEYFFVVYHHTLVWFKEQGDELPVGGLTLGGNSSILIAERDSYNCIELQTPVMFKCGSSSRKEVRNVSLMLRGDNLDDWTAVLRRQNTRK